MWSTVRGVAEYAKSGRSSCRKCSDAIENGALRLSSVLRDPRGGEIIRWHHVPCFTFGSNEAQDIEGFDFLEDSDQEVLKKLVAAIPTAQTEVTEEANEEKESMERNTKNIKLDSARIVAEYAKSGRSACRRCKETIKGDALRLGVEGRGPRGLDILMWRHMACFTFESDSTVSVQDIEGFESLKENDQEALKKLVAAAHTSQNEVKEDGDEEKESMEWNTEKTKVSISSGDEENESTETNTVQEELVEDGDEEKEKEPMERNTEKAKVINKDGDEEKAKESTEKNTKKAKKHSEAKGLKKKRPHEAFGPSNTTGALSIGPLEAAARSHLELRLSPTGSGQFGVAEDKGRGKRRSSSAVEETMQVESGRECRDRVLAPIGSKSWDDLLFYRALDRLNTLKGSLGVDEYLGFVDVMEGNRGKQRSFVSVSDDLAIAYVKRSLQTS